MTFTGSSNDPAATYAWDFDYDGATFDTEATGPSVTHPFNTVGEPTVGLRVSDNCGPPATATAQIVVGNTPPTAEITSVLPNPVNPGIEVTFKATANDLNNDTLTYAWSLDGDANYNEPGEEGEVNLATTKRTYPTARSLTVRLRVSDGHGGVAFDATNLTVNRPPVAQFSWSPDPPVIGEAVTFDARQNPLDPTQGSYDLENTIVKYEWDLAGNDTWVIDDATPPPHIYNAARRVAVGLRVTDEDGGVTTIRRNVDVQVSRPTARLRFSPAAPLPGQRVTLTSTSMPSATGAAQLVNTQWDLSYQPTADFHVDAAGPSISTSFSTPGPKTVAVKVFQTGGGYDIAFLTIVVNAPPRASFDIAPDAPIEGDQITFASTSGDPDNPIAKQEWDLDGDNQFDDAAGAVASTKSFKRGAHTVRLRVTDSRGAVATAQKSVTVAAKPLKPPPDVGKSFYYTPAKWGMKLAVLVVKVPSRTKVTVRCKGRGCPRGTFRKSSKKKAARLRFKQVKGSLRAGAKISVMSTRSGHIGEYVTYTVRGQFRQPAKRERCFWANPKKLRACPT